MVQNEYSILSYDQFCKEIKEISENDDTWLLKQSGCEIYLEKTEIKIGVVEESNCFEDEQIVGDDTSIMNGNHYYKWTYNIVYHQTQCVPMICFNVYDNTGCLVKLLHLHKLLNVDNIDSAELFQLVTQMDHPILQTPFFAIHPCKANDVIRSFKSTNLVLSWLSVYAPFLKLELPLKIFSIA